MSDRCLVPNLGLQPESCEHPWFWGHLLGLVHQARPCQRPQGQGGIPKVSSPTSQPSLRSPCPADLGPVTTRRPPFPSDSCLGSWTSPPPPHRAPWAVPPPRPTSDCTGCQKVAWLFLSCTSTSVPRPCPLLSPPPITPGGPVLYLPSAYLPSGLPWKARKGLSLHSSPPHCA